MPTAALQTKTPMEIALNHRDELPNALAGITATLFSVIELLLEKRVVTPVEILARMQEIISADKHSAPDDGFSSSAKLVAAWTRDTVVSGDASLGSFAPNLPAVLTGQTEAVISLIKILIKKDVFTEDDIKGELNDLLLDREQQSSNAGFDAAAKHIIKSLESAKK